MSKEYLLLKSVNGINDLYINRIYEKRGKIRGIFSCSFEELLSCGISSEVAENIVYHRYNEKFADNELKKAEKEGVKIITIDDEDYPSLLKEIYTPPFYFYVKGNISALKENMIAIVGSRKCTAEGENFARKIAGDLASSGIVVVSGFARGIDIAAHRGAAEKGSTVAVIGSGLNNIYPDKNIQYLDKILLKGCVISEYPFNEKPFPYNFPRRNRIISGLSLGVLIVEASARSGTLITARLALEQNRQVFAVPHFPLAFNSAGNTLIKQGAIITESYLDIIGEFKNIFKSAIYEKEKPFPYESGIKRKIWDELKMQPLTCDSLSIKLEESVINIMINLSELEMEGFAKKNESGEYISLKAEKDG